MRQYFSDFFYVDPQAVEDHGAFNISLISDLPLFIDPFLLFNSDKQEYRALHNGIIAYLRFLRSKSASGNLRPGLIKAWFCFPEVRQNWFGFSIGNNRGSGLGIGFAKSLNKNLHRIFTDFGAEQVTRGSHLEKLCLFNRGVGRDNISDFTTNLIHEFLLEYTQEFAIANVAPELRKVITIPRVAFNYDTESWASASFDLPFLNGEYVLLTPKDLLTKDETWINKPDLYDNFEEVPKAIPNDALRAEVNNYFEKMLPINPETKEPEQTKKARRTAAEATVQEFPEVLDYYIRRKEDTGYEAETISSWKVKESERLYVDQFKKLAEEINRQSRFYDLGIETIEECKQRVLYLKQVVENGGGYRFFYRDDGKRIDRETDVHILYQLTWFATPSDINREVNNGRGPVDFKVSRGNRDKSLVEFKLAKNTQLKRQLQKQVEIYEAANETKKSLKVIFYFSSEEHRKVTRILMDLDLTNHPDIYLIDARSDNKPSASKA